MIAILTWIDTNILVPLLGAFITYETPKISSWIMGLISAQAQKKQDASNVAAEQAAAQSGDLNALQNTESNILNGTKPPGSP